jgi:hypothetical protein
MKEKHMSNLDTATHKVSTPRPTRRRTVLRWLVSFTGFPLGGLAAIILTGPVDHLTAALAGGLVTGVILGASQAWALGPTRVRAASWIAATSAGVMTGLALGASVVDYHTDLASLAVQGAITGAAVGAAQAIVLLPRLGAPALSWPVFLAGVWAAGWAITTLGGIQVDEQFTVFGSFGAITATLLTVGLPLVLDRRDVRANAS